MQRLLWGKQSKEFSQMMSSKDSKPMRENLAVHTQPPEPFPGLETMLRKLYFPAKFTTPCQSLVPSCCLRLITAAKRIFQEVLRTRKSSGHMYSGENVVPLLAVKKGAFALAAYCELLPISETVWGCANHRVWTKSLCFCVVLLCLRSHFLAIKLHLNN